MLDVKLRKFSEDKSLSKNIVIPIKLFRLTCIDCHKLTLQKHLYEICIELWQDLIGGLIVLEFSHILAST